MLLILFGTPGVGKNYVGRMLQDEFGFHFYDADIDLTPEMTEAIHRGELFTDEMRWQFYNIVNSRIHDLQKQYPRIAVAQALAKEKNRIQIMHEHPIAQFVLIHAQEDCIYERLCSRNDWVSPEFARKVQQAFEWPRIDYYSIENNHGYEEVFNQLKQLFKL